MRSLIIRSKGLVTLPLVNGMEAVPDTSVCMVFVFFNLFFLLYLLLLFVRLIPETARVGRQEISTKKRICPECAYI